VNWTVFDADEIREIGRGRLEATYGGRAADLTSDRGRQRLAALPPYFVDILTTFVARWMRRQRLLRPGSSMGPFCVTRSNPTHRLTDLTQPHPLQVEKFGPNPTHQKLKNLDPNRPNPTQPMGQPNPWTTLPGTQAQYCDERVCLSVCLASAHPNFTKCSVHAVHTVLGPDLSKLLKKI